VENNIAKHNNDENIVRHESQPSAKKTWGCFYLSSVFVLLCFQNFSLKVTDIFCVKDLSVIDIHKKIK